VSLLPQQGGHAAARCRPERLSICLKKLPIATKNRPAEYLA